MKRPRITHETILALTILGFALVIGLVNPAFFSAGNLFNLIKSSVVLGILSLGLLVVLVSGGIDVSIPSISVFALYVTASLLVSQNFEGSILIPFIISALMGTGLGLINGFFISTFQVPALIVTLGTMSAFRGFMLAFIGSTIISNLPPAMVAFSRWNLLQVVQGRARYGLHGSLLILLACAILTWLLLQRTMLGRGIHAYGGDPQAAKRAGFDTRKIQYFVYAYAGFLAGLAGTIHSSISRFARPFDMLGTELTVIAAVVLGGARITGGRGTVMGTLLGVFLVSMIENNLILMGIPSYWQDAVLGLLILIGTGVPAYRAKLQAGRSSAPA